MDKNRQQTQKTRQTNKWQNIKSKIATSSTILTKKEKKTGLEIYISEQVTAVLLLHQPIENYFKNNKKSKIIRQFISVMFDRYGTKKRVQCHQFRKKEFWFYGKYYYVNKVNEPVTFCITSNAYTIRQSI